jgi:hypothetical protein
MDDAVDHDQGFSLIVRRPRWQYGFSIMPSQPSRVPCLKFTEIKMASFDAETLRQLSTAREVSIRTDKHPKSDVVIWVVVAENEVFVRSWRGARGRWYRDLAQGGLASLELNGSRLPVRAVPANDPATIARVSDGFMQKYRTSSHAPEMVRPETLPTTLWLAPR